MTISDDQIAAWLHGGLSETEATQVKAMIEADPQATRRLGEMQRLDALIRKAIPLEPQLPPELIARLGLDNAPVAKMGDADNVIDFASARAARAVPAQPPAERFRGATAQRWLWTAQAAAVVGIAVIGLQFMPSPQQPDANPGFRTLSDAPAATAGGNAIVVFAPGIDAGEARSIMAATGARIIGEPSSTGAWQIDIHPARRDATLSALRAKPQVAMAEAIDGAGR
jgi:anti-sigma factor RsiW